MYHRPHLPHLSRLPHLPLSLLSPFPLHVILGPTAAGKTSYALSLAERLRKDTGSDSEIVNADSRQLYRFLDIGTAKIRSAEMRGIPHHLLSVKNPDESITAAWYQKEAFRVIHDIFSRGHCPILVGGSMLFVSSVIDGLTFAPAIDNSVRRRLREHYDSDGGASLFRELSVRDPEAALSIDPRNKIYLIRAMEILEGTGLPLSQARSKNGCPYPLYIIGIDQPREVLNCRITERIRQMFAEGWIEEVESIIASGYGKEDPGMLSHGYREIVAFLLADDRNEAAKEQLIETIARKTRAYAKRQRTWWRNDPRIAWKIL